MIFVARALIFFCSFVLIVLTAIGAVGAIGVWGVLTISGRDLVLDPKRIPFWPEALPGFELHASAGPFYLTAGLALLFFVLPLALALLEKLYLVIPSERSERGASKTRSDRPN